MRRHHEDNGIAIANLGKSASSKADRNLRRRGFLALLVSSLLHVAVIIMLFLLVNVNPHRTRAEALREWLTKKPAPINNEMAKKENRIIVQINPVVKSERPKEAHYFAEHDQSSVAEKSAKLRVQKKAEASDDNHVTKDNDLSTEAQKPAHGQMPAHKINKNDPLGLRPKFNERAYAKSGGEFIPDVKESDKTELNAWQWRHAPFFNRVKDRIGQTWSPQSQIARFDPQGSLLGQKDRITILQVTIDRQGNLRDLKITNQSGVSYLDDEAERAFRAAAPFLYPPQELFNDGDEFSFTFAFHLYLDRGFSFGFDWQND